MLHITIQKYTNMINVPSDSHTPYSPDRNTAQVGNSGMNLTQDRNIAEGYK
jgi:hypothetical protein